MPTTSSTQSRRTSFIASVSTVRTLVDGGIRVVLDLDENSISVAAFLMEMKRLGVALNIKAEPVEYDPRRTTD